MLRRSWFPLVAWLVLLVSVVSLYGSPARHRIGADSDVTAFNVKGRARGSDGDSWPAAGNRRTHKFKHTQVNAAAQGWLSAGDPNSDGSTTRAPDRSGWSLGKVGNWLQKVVDARKSWSRSSQSDPATQAPPGTTGLDPNPSGTAGSSPVPAGAAGTGGSTGGGSSTTGGGKVGSPVGSNAGAGPTGSGGSLTAVSVVPGSAAISGATSSVGSAGVTLTGNGTGDSAAVPPSPAPPGPLPQTRDPALWPFAATSPWNYPIGSKARYAPMVTGQGSQWDDLWLTDTNSIWIGTASDPMLSLYRDDRVGSTHYKRVQNVPAAATSVFLTSSDELNGGDTPSTWISADHLVAQDFQGTYYDQRTRSFHAAYGGLTDIDLKGNGWDQNTMALNGQGVDGSTASPGFPYFAGCIRQGELSRGLIPHALAYFTDPSYWSFNAPGGRGFVWPATQRDNLEAGQVGTQGNLYFGSLIALLPSFNVNALKTPEARTIALALQRYGAYTINSSPGWGNQGGIYMDGAVRADVPGYPEYTGPSSPDDYVNDMRIITHALQVVTNSHHDGGQPVGGVKLDGGDGALLAPLAPPFDR